jgi:hypothetical protein
METGPPKFRTIFADPCVQLLGTPVTFRPQILKQLNKTITLLVRL